MFLMPIVFTPLSCWSQTSQWSTLSLKQLSETPTYSLLTLHNSAFFSFLTNLKFSLINIITIVIESFVVCIDFTIDVSPIFSVPSRPYDSTIIISIIMPASKINLYQEVGHEMMICTFSELQLSRGFIKRSFLANTRPRPELQCTGCSRPLPLPWWEGVGGGWEGEGGEVTFRGFGSARPGAGLGQLGRLHPTQPSTLSSQGWSPLPPATTSPPQPCTSAPSFNPSPPPAEPPSYILFTPSLHSLASQMQSTTSHHL